MGWGGDGRGDADRARTCLARRPFVAAVPGTNGNLRSPLHSYCRIAASGGTRVRLNHPATASEGSDCTAGMPRRGWRGLDKFKVKFCKTVSFTNYPRNLNARINRM